MSTLSSIAEPFLLELFSMELLEANDADCGLGPSSPKFSGMFSADNGFVSGLASDFDKIPGSAGLIVVERT